MAIRDDLTSLVFGDSLPTTESTIEMNVVSPLGLMPNLEKTDKLTATVVDENTFGYLFHPLSFVRDRLVIVHQGHDQALNATGVGDCIRALVENGFHALALQMPGFGGNEGSVNHADYGNKVNGLRWFIEPVIQHINAIIADYSDVSMVGLSGGGWTTTVVAAIDERIKLSIEVAGSLPWSLRGSSSIGDWEQAAVRSAAEYEDMYLLACSNGRRRVQILNRNDSCCFGYANPRGAYGDNYVQNIVTPIHAASVSGGGSYAWYEDLTHSIHQISFWALQHIILPELYASGLTPSGINQSQINTFCLFTGGF